MTREQLLVDCFGSADFPPGDVVLQVKSGEDILAHVDVYWRAVEVAGADVDVAAIAQVSTDPAYRRLGLATALVRTAHRVAGEHGVEWAALFGVDPLYTRIGYFQPAATPSPDFLVCPLRDGLEWPVGPIDTRGQW